MGPVSRRILGNESIRGALSRDVSKDKEKNEWVIIRVTSKFEI